MVKELRNITAYPVTQYRLLEGCTPLITVLQLLFCSARATI
jgi:hypothetical protein